MKIVRLKLQNLASLAGEQEIDFEAEPLQHAGLIAITGATGAGKSTLLDAMCLALFNKIPRLKTHEGKLKDVSGQDIQIDSTLNILRRGTAHAYSELEFIAQNQKRYIARWELKRARGHAEGKLQAVQRALLCVSDGTLLTDKTKECDKQILDLIGLSFEQFTRAVLLAQSEVGAFLKAKDNERADLLEYLTNSNIFSLVGKAAFEKTKAVRLQREKLNELIGHVELLSPEQVLELEQHLKDQQQQLQQLEQQRQILENERQWHKSHHLLYTQIQGKQEFYLVQLDANQKLAEQRQQLQQLEQFAAIRPVLIQQKRCEQQLQGLEHRLAQHQQQFQLLNGQYQSAQQRYQSARQALEQEKTRQQQLAPFIDQARQLLDQRKLIESQYVQIRSRLKDKTAEQQQLAPQLQQAETQQQQLEQVQQQFRQQLAQSQHLSAFDHEPQASLQQLKAYIAYAQELQQQLPERFTAHYYDTVQAKCKSLEHNLQLLHQQNANTDQLEQTVQQLYQQREQQMERGYQLEQLQQQLQHWQQQYQEQQTLSQGIHQLENEMQQLQATAAEQQLSHEHCKRDRELLQKQLQQQRLLFSDQVEQLRRALQPNEPCAVCGSVQHPYREQQHLLEKTLLNVQEQQEQAYLQAEQEAQRLWQATQQQYLKQDTSRSHLQQQQQRLNEQIQQRQQSLQDLACSLGITLLWEQAPEQLIPLVQQAQQVQQHHHEQLNLQISKIQAVQKQLSSLTQQLDQARQQAANAQQLQQLARPILDKLPPARQQDYYQHSYLDAQALEQAFQARLSLLQEVQAQEQALAQLQQQLHPQRLQQQHLHEYIGQLEQELEQLKQQGLDNVIAVQQLTREASGTSYEQAQHWLENLEQQRQQLEQQLMEQQQHYEALQQDHQHQQAGLTELQATHRHVKQDLDQAQTQLTQWLDTHPDYHADLLVQLLAVTSQQEQRIRQQLQSHDQVLSEAKTALQTLQEQFEQHLSSKPAHEFEQLHTLLADLDLQLNRVAEERDQLRMKLEIQQRNLKKQQQFQSQIVEVQQEEYRWNRISELIGSADGSRFKKIAQEHHLDILVEYANQQLQPLASRYQLQRIENSLGLAIIDHHMNGEVRPVLSLSGGETFLVSLALALAIANMAAGSMKIESLFIDEGFGTLDPASLHVVMDALDRLQGQGRKVTLISHVQEMHERIPIQIQVKAIGSGASRIQIVG